MFEIAASRWRMRRLIVMEKAVIESEMERVLANKENPVTHPQIARMRAFTAVAGSPAMKQIHRYENRLRRASEKAQKELEAVQTERYQRNQMLRELENRELQNEEFENLELENFELQDDAPLCQESMDTEENHRMTEASRYSGSVPERSVSAGGQNEPVSRTRAAA